MSAAQTDPELAERLREVRERIRKRLERPVPSVFEIPVGPSVPELSLPPIEPLRDAVTAARQLAVAIGKVNPRPPGLVNAAIQTVKQAMARMLEWHVRPQRDFNQSVAESLEKIAERLETNHRMLAERLEANHRNLQKLADSLQPLVRLCQELAQDVAAAQDYFDERMKLQRWTYEGSLVRQSKNLQERVTERERRLTEMVDALREQIQKDLRALRQRVATPAKAGEARVPTAFQEERREASISSGPRFDYFRFEQAFRGTEEEIRRRQSFYLPFFRGRKNVLDLACGRGEFLELMREMNVPARGVDLDTAMIGRCREKGLDVVSADVFAYLSSVSEGSLDGIFCAHFLEHLPPEAYVELISQCVQKLAPSGVLAVETPNPECLAIFSQTFYLDPTHRQPIPPAQLRFLFAESGLTQISTHFLSPASAGLPVIPLLASQVLEADRLRAWNEAVTRFNEAFFGGMDYAVLGHRPTFASPGA